MRFLVADWYQEREERSGTRVHQGGHCTLYLLMSHGKSMDTIVMHFFANTRMYLLVFVMVMMFVRNLTDVHTLGQWRMARPSNRFLTVLPGECY